MIFGTKKVRKRVGLFGGSFNPPHVGHTAICRWLFDHGIVDELWVIPCLLHPFGKKILPFADRLAMCRMAFSKLSLPIEISEIERELGGISFTLRTVKELLARHPELRFLLITGEDVKEEAAKWHDFDKIRDLIETVHLPRGQNSPIPDVSSTQVRERVEARQQVADLVEPEVAIYIVTKGLFR